MRESAPACRHDAESVRDAPPPLAPARPRPLRADEHRHPQRRERVALPVGVQAVEPLEGVAPPEDDLLHAARGGGADLVVVGHTHWPVDRTAGGVRVVNVGSVGMPIVPGLGAAYVLLDADAGGYRLRFRRVAYDHAAVVAALHRVRHPGADWIADHYAGRRRPPWTAAAPLPASWPAAAPG
jgi:hypothetical protein